MSLKLCKDCKWFRVPKVKILFWEIEYDIDYAKCNHPKNSSLVTGKANKYCDLERRYSITNCKEEGILWEAK